MALTAEALADALLPDWERLDWAELPEELLLAPEEDETELFDTELPEELPEAEFPEELLDAELPEELPDFV